MTKISNTQQFSGLEKHRPKISSGSNPSGFQQVFDDLLHCEANEAPVLASVTRSAGPAHLRIDSIEPLPANTGLQAMERFIDSLDNYQQRLADPDWSLRDIEPVLERLEEAHRHLSDVSEKTRGDNPLKDIINEGLVTATMEISRFRSGMYC